MSLFVDQTYIGLIGQRLNLFRQVKSDLYNFRCPICGDSSKNEYKRRAYFYKNKSGEGFNFQCHNCGGSHSLYKFIEIVFPEFIKQYKFETFSSSGKSIGLIEEAIPFKKLEVIFDGITPMDLLPDDHPAVRYLLNERRLPVSLLERFLHVDKYVEWLKETTQDEDLKYKEHSRILIPYTNKNDHIYRYVARSYDSDYAAKYLYTDLDLGSPIYNFYHVDHDKKIYAVEGQIDAMLIGQQAIALGNGKYDQHDLTSFKDCVIIPDNECRNVQIVNSLGKAIDSGLSVCIWPTFYGKDINDMILNGLKIEEILEIVDSNTFSGIKAKIKFQQWRKTINDKSNLFNRR
jgi:hypothetical protein